jgi:S-adenosylmethionine:tRNA ribosyltransferase-isomerase
MNTSQLDYHLPQRLIAQHALINRTDSRMMVIDRANGTITHRGFSDIIEYLKSGDCLVINDSRVIPARFYLQRATGGKIEGLFLNTDDQNRWQVMLKNAARLKIGEMVNLIKPLPDAPDENEIKIKIIEKTEPGCWLIQPQTSQSYLTILDSYGVTPLPPYIHRDYSRQTEQLDRQRYQTVYAQQAGSVAAPTAGLHFNEQLLAGLKAQSIAIARVTLHVGPGTFKPVTVEKLQDHKIHSEWYQLDQTNASIINNAIDTGGKIIAVGTTSVRVLETIAKNNRVKPSEGWTELFITSGYKFQIVSAMLTNFHLPRSTLLALVCAFAGTELIMQAYRQAVQQEYRFYSYGDAMLII